MTVKNTHSGLQNSGKHGMGPLKKTMIALHFLTLLLMTASCATTAPKGVSPVTEFDIQRYLGRWYEIARLDHPFERGLERVYADYSLRPDGGVGVLNQGYDPLKKVWKQAEGRAYFLGDPTVGSLKVSFFGPFYGGYHIIHLDRKAYAHAMVCGPDLSYLWILCRTPEIDEAVLESLIHQARQMGFAVDALIYVTHDRHGHPH